MDVTKLMVVALAGWINQQQQDVIDYLREEVRILKGPGTLARVEVEATEMKALVEGGELQF